LYLHWCSKSLASYRQLDRVTRRLAHAGSEAPQVGDMLFTRKRSRWGIERGSTPNT
jgi:hypothetical protein